MTYSVSISHLHTSPPLTLNSHSLGTQVARIVSSCLVHQRILKLMLIASPLVVLVFRHSFQGWVLTVYLAAGGHLLIILGLLDIDLLRLRQRNGVRMSATNNILGSGWRSSR